MIESSTSLPAERDEQEPAGIDRLAKRGRLIAGAALVILLLVVAGTVALDREEDSGLGLVFTIPSGRYQAIAIPGIDSAIALPTRIAFAPGEDAAITIINEDVVAHRAGPFVVGARQTYTQRFPGPGEYLINCSVDPAESIEVIVER